ncbi:hypothetical protein GWK47_045054 [Chionoecetes opilio]|uniref:Uncharacterized protein n=1 Tax=Chionoecetes opilio TaxID=41210 RepID=A0A8J4YED4_CHIOP|nr:hypothetical protein GWK47_045054 [Chionoecetes opilio]
MESPEGTPPRSTQEQTAASPRAAAAAPGPAAAAKDPTAVALAPQHPTDTQNKVLSFSAACNGRCVFYHHWPPRGPHALHTSPLGKTSLKGETRSLGRSALGCAVGECYYQGAILQDVTFTLGDWQVICRHVPRGGRCPRSMGRWVSLSDEIKDLEGSAGPEGPGRQ